MFKYIIYHTVIITLSAQDLKLNSRKLSLTHVTFFSSDALGDVGDFV